MGNLRPHFNPTLRSFAFFLVVVWLNHLPKSADPMASMNSVSRTSTLSRASAAENVTSTLPVLEIDLRPRAAKPTHSNVRSPVFASVKLPFRIVEHHRRSFAFPSLSAFGSIDQVAERLGLGRKAVTAKLG